MRFRDDAWFSGFIDAEGCFTRGSSRGEFYPKFAIGLRQDDFPLLNALRHEFGGSLTVHHQIGGNRQPAARWVLYGGDLWNLIEYLDRFPLRAKKAEQYAAWRKEHDL